MAVRKMIMMNLVAGLDDIDFILKKIALSEQVHVVNAMEEIDESNFTLSMMEKNVDEIVNMSAIKPYRTEKNLKIVKEKILTLLELMNVTPTIRQKDFDEDYHFDEVMMTIDEIYNKMHALYRQRDAYKAELSLLKEMRIFDLLSKVDVDIGRLFHSKKFDVIIGTLTNDSKKKLSQNYENVSAAVMHLGLFDNEEAILVVTPKVLRTETDRILKSVHFKPFEIVGDYLSTPKIYMESINKRIQQIEYELKKSGKESQSYKSTYGEEVIKCHSRLVMEEVILTLKENIATTKRFFYFSGWIAEDHAVDLKEHLEKDRTVIIDFKHVNEVVGGIHPPTLLKNNRLFKPFETLVEMYGTPSYEELDPTVFLGISYMILFGSMFGDFGQGLVLALVGLLLAKRSANKSYGQLLMRMGISSSVFGFFYDSFFGYEHVISTAVGKLFGNDRMSELFFIRPIENINTILSLSIILGIVLLLISFLYSIINKVGTKDYQEGLFGRNGISGLVLYCSLLLIVAAKVNLFEIGTALLIGLSIVCIVLIIVREPLANKIAGKKELYHEETSAYYVESGFDILETFLSMLSNSVSFIRVGAFALNHVGLFIAFHTMADIIDNVAGDISMFIIGNLLVIFLEGLIVFIQGLRLVYYELFSKYYTGAGNPFEPVYIQSLERA